MHGHDSESLSDAVLFTKVVDTFDQQNAGSRLVCSRSEGTVTVYDVVLSTQQVLSSIPQ